MIMREISHKNLWNKIPFFFVSCYFLVGIVNNLYLGGNPKQIFLPILLLIFAFFLASVSDERFLKKYKLSHLLIATDVFLLINIIIFITGKVNVESQFFKILLEKTGVNFKIILIVTTALLLAVKIYFRKKLLGFSFLFTLIFFFGFILIIPFLYPEPFIDLYVILKQSIVDIFANKDPYERVFPDIYDGVQDYAYRNQQIKLVYWPMNVFLLAPFQFLFGDLRFAYVFFLLASCLVLYFGFNRNKLVFYASFILLFSNPYTFYMVKYAWIDILALPFFALYFICFQQKKYVLSFVILGILMSLKLYFIVLFPLSLIYFFNIEKDTKKAILLMIVSVAVMGICFLPYLVTNPKAILYTLEYFANSFPRYDSLSIPGYVFQFGYNIDKMCSAISVLFILWIFFRTYKKKEISIYSQIRNLTMILFVLFILAKQAFGNYYYNLMFLGIVYLCFVISVTRQKSED